MPPKGTAAPPQTRTIARCVYCGQPLTPAQARRWPGTCGSHADLPARDPNYMRVVRTPTS